ncbi:protein chibby homolog 1-like [Ciona intestinalis]|uniref:protein chibby homolog 1-like n=1 Tax=Ciona intestinalis TaxID=7719 RepID=UPI0000522CFF|nr:protein chibby homolog 1-like [Ciona intestinalis]|eukprot:XP_002127656.3 protein chibby homolog 1-like [Ciona intestinalis]
MLSLFSPKGFSPKKATPRKAASLSNLASLDVSQRAQEFGLDYGSASLKLNGNELKFEDGAWQSEGGAGGVPHREMIKLKKENTRITEENNMLRLKIDILLDMLSEATAESHILEKERDDAVKRRKK